MDSRLKDIEHEILALGAEDRARLAESLLESLRGPPLTEIDIAWAREIENRVAAHDRGEVPTYAAEDVFAEARRLSR
jgi:putative addiction module component (TIGR02574 family)